jgi:hypothetical protein
MNIRSRPLIAIVAVMVLTLAGGGAAFAVNKSRSKSNSNSTTQPQQQQQQQQGDCPGHLGDGRDGPGGPAAFLAAAAKYVGLSNDQLWSRLMSGQSLADIAKAQGKSVDGLKVTLVNAASDRLQKAVDAGDLTVAQKNAILDQIRSRVDEVINHGLPLDRGEPSGARPGAWDDGDGPYDGPGSSGDASFGPPAASAWA